jgi:hypothetical protein
MSRSISFYRSQFLAKGRRDAALAHDKGASLAPEKYSINPETF